MNDKIILLTKEILRCDYLPVYGNTYWKTPYLDALAARGTVFRSHYTNAPSTAMAVTCLFSGLEAHELARRYYSEVEVFDQAPTVFTLLQERGYATHVLWTEGEHRATYPYSKCYGEGTRFHKVKSSPEDFAAALESISEDRFFLWIHMPTVLGDRPSLGSDIDLFDDFVGKVMRAFPGADLYVSADHGHMNLEKGIPVYGFHVYEGAIHVPFISPRIGDLAEVSFPTSHRQFKEILFEGRVSRAEYVYSDTQYYLQAHRTLAIIKGRFKFIFNKYDGSEELYDLDWDPQENVNLLHLLNGRSIVEPFRQRVYEIRTMFFYPYLEEAQTACAVLRSRKQEIWKTGTPLYEATRKLYQIYLRTLFMLKCRFRAYLTSRDFI